MSLPRSALSGHQLTRQLPTTSGHACLTQGNSRDIRYAAHPGTSFAAALIRCPPLALRVHSQLARWQAWVAKTDSAANHYGQLRAENPRHHLRFL
jgi:hypothetical protein